MSEFSPFSQPELRTSPDTRVTSQQHLLPEARSRPASSAGRFRYTGSRIVGEACARIPLTRQAVGEDGLIADFVVREEILAVLAALAAAADRG